MLRKLDRLGFRDYINSFFKSYLTDRQTYVNIGGHDSTVRTTNIGLPQGSVSATWLFSLYINDLHRTSNKLNFIHFADDTTVYMSGRDLTVLCREVCEELNAIDDWLKANRLSLNTDKTYFMIHTHNKFDINDYSIKIRDKTIKYVRSTKFLGLILDDRFSYSDHVSQLVKQLSKIKGVLLKLSHVVPSFVIRKIYYALFYSRISCNITVWGNGNVTDVNRVRKINKSVMDIFLNKVPNSIPRPFLYNDLYNFACLKTLHIYNYNEFFTYFNEKFWVLHLFTIMAQGLWVILVTPCHLYLSQLVTVNFYSRPLNFGTHCLCTWKKWKIRIYSGLLLNLGFPVIYSSIFPHYSVISVRVSFAVHAFFL